MDAKVFVVEKGLSERMAESYFLTESDTSKDKPDINPITRTLQQPVITG